MTWPQAWGMKVYVDWILVPIHAKKITPASVRNGSWWRGEVITLRI